MRGHRLLRASPQGHRVVSHGVTPGQQAGDEAIARIKQILRQQARAWD
jgi:hypothetical protein